jgi:putative hydrolase of the HAD superfamily
MPRDLRQIFRAEVWLGDFDVHVFSSDIGLIKPEPGIYRELLDALKLPPQKVFFVDDVPANVEGARRAGIGGMVYRSFDELSDHLAPLIADLPAEQ